VLEVLFGVAFLSANVGIPPLFPRACGKSRNELRLAVCRDWDSVLGPSGVLVAASVRPHREVAVAAMAAQFPRPAFGLARRAPDGEVAAASLWLRVHLAHTTAMWLDLAPRGPQDGFHLPWVP
jgi:hypothetical protein